MVLTFIIADIHHPMQRATVWQLRSRRLELTERPLVMGIVNVTPDSFSDGGQFCDPGRAVEHALRLVAEGADLLDIGGESTRPYATPVSADEEWRRVGPVLQALAQQQSAGSISKVALSIDTSKASVARRALDAGVEIINDVTALSGDPEMLLLAVSSGAGVCAMHMLGTPQTMQNDPRYEDVVAEIAAYLCQRRDMLFEAGIEPGRLCLDPGIGFGKTHAHNLELLRNCWRFHTLGCPLLVGHSRKGFIGKLLAADNVSVNPETDRTFGTLGASLALARQGVQVLRVHDVAATRQALLLFAAAGGLEGI